MTGVEIIKIFELKYPKNLAYESDNIGLQIGTLNKKVSKIMIALDITKEVVKEAISKNIDLIISHHPIIYMPISSIKSDSYKGNMINNLIKNDISVYVAHTNFDIAHGGMNDFLAHKLNLENIEILEEITQDEGIGRIGDINKLSMKEFIDYAKKTFNVNNARFIGNLDKNVSRVAISGGSGSKHIGIAKRKGADIYITGDITYHVGHDILSLGLSVLDLGHNIEKCFKEAVKDYLEDKINSAQIILSDINTEPYIFV